MQLTVQGIQRIGFLSAQQTIRHQLKSLYPQKKHTTWLE
jgi:hypothetical protein